jgi:dynein heavy chain
MFAMDLAHYQEIADQIISNASRELAIERGVQEIADIWKKLEFKLIHHSKGTEDRGYILGSVDELNQVKLKTYNIRNALFFFLKFYI